MIYYLYISKFKNPEFQNPKINNYSIYKLDLNIDFINGVALACYQITSVENIYKYVMISEDGKNIDSIYDYANHLNLLENYMSENINNASIISFKGKKLGYPYIIFVNDEFTNGWNFLYEYFKLDQTKYFTYI